MTTSNPYIGAYPWLNERRGVWREIVRYVARDAPRAQTVLELGAGYCDFINQFPAPKKLAFDLNPDSRRYAASEVELHVRDCTALAGIGDETLDLVFASNFFEHLSERELGVLIPNIRRVLRPGGRLILLQPNYRRCADHYFDDPTHKTIFHDENIADYLVPHGLRVVKLVAGLMPFSMKSRLPKWPILIRLYLMSPVKPQAKQMYIVAERS